MHPRIGIEARPIAFQQLLFQRSNQHGVHQDTSVVAVDDPMRVQSRSRPAASAGEEGRRFFFCTADLVHRSHPRSLPDETSRLSCVTHYCPSTTVPFWFHHYQKNGRSRRTIWSAVLPACITSCRLRAGGSCQARRWRDSGQRRKQHTLSSLADQRNWSIGRADTSWYPARCRVRASRARVAGLQLT
jgi:hypothetical protein